MYTQAMDTAPKEERKAIRSAEEAVKANTARLGQAFAEGVRAFREAMGNPGTAPGPDDAGDDSEAETVDEIVAKKKSRAASQRHPTMPGGL